MHDILKRRHQPGATLLALGTAMAIVACAGGGGDEQAAGETASSAAASTQVAVSITMPANGDTIRGDAVHVMLSATGIEIAPAAQQRPGTAHHHLYLDTDLGTPETPIPAGQANIIHLGNAETEYHWAGLTPGEHRIIAILADPLHVPLNPLTADTVTFVVVR